MLVRYYLLLKNCNIPTYFCGNNYQVKYITEVLNCNIDYKDI